MLLNGLKHSFKAVDELLITVHTKMEPGVALNGYFLRTALESEHVAATVFLECLLLVLEVLLCLAQCSYFLFGQ